MSEWHETCLDRPQILHPLSSVQREIWFEQSLYPNTPLYNIGCYTKINGEIDPALFRQAITLLVQESDALRMMLTEQDGVPLQSFSEISHVDVDLYDYSQANNPLQKALSAMQQVIAQPFKLFTEPLFRYTLYKLADNSYLWSMVYHHLVSDGWGLALITKRVAALYNALLQDEQLPARPGVHYLEFVANDTAYLESTHFDRHHDYWQKKFTSLPEPLLSPKVGYANRTDIVPGAVHSWFLPRAQYDQLVALAQSHQLSVFHALLGLLYVYFTRTYDRDECIIGVPVHNRNTPAFKQTIGLFASSIPACFNHGKETTFVELMQSIAKSLRASYRNQRFPISEIHNLAGVFQAGRKRLFDISLSFDNHDHDVCFGFGGTSETMALVNHGFEQSPLVVFISEHSKIMDIQIQFSYNLAYFDAEEIECIQSRFICLLEDVLDHSEQPIAKLNILPPQEKQQLLIDWNTTATPLPASSVQQLFEAQAKATPRATAVVFENESLSYDQLNTRANQLAHHLISLGVEAETLVAIALERSPAMIVAMLAVLKAGGAYVPLDPDYPTDRLAYMLEDCGAQILVTRQCLRERLPQSAAHTLCLDTDWAALAGKPQTNPDRLVSPEQLAYVIYTSGSTGKPKGVAIEHRGLSNLARAQSLAFGLTRQSRVLQFASTSFDASISELVMTLCSGAALCIPNAEQRQPGTPLWQHLEENAITHLTLPPTALAVMPQQPLPALKHLIVAGEACPPSLAKHWSHDRRFSNAYGPTETTVCATIAECAHADIDAESTLPIGRPIDNTQIYILDRHNQPTPIGVAGELHIGGAGLARGYLNRPELTAGKFIPDPFSDVPGARLYKTGDLARYHADGNIEFLGRIDHQVKIRGFRIELGEIEATLAGHPDVRDAVAIARCEENGEKRLVAYLVGDQHADAKELRAFLKNTLPDYMLPAAFVYLEALPLTPNGKVDRKALPEPKASAAQHDAVAPRDDLEQIMTDLWSSVLSQPHVGIHDNFFELGGHSLLATQLTSRLRDTFAVEVPVRWLFEAPTVAELTERIRTSNAHSEHVVTEPDNVIPANTSQDATDRRPLIDLSQTEIDQIARTVAGGADNIQDIYPMAPLQEGILFHHMLQDSRDAYLSHLLLAFDSRVRCEAFIAALQSVINRHDILRTSIAWEQLPEPVQVVWRQVILPVEILQVDPAVGPIADQLMEYCHLRHTRIDLTKAPLLHIVLAQDNDRWLMVFLSHHLIMDHTTLEVILEEIAAHLQGNEELLSPPVPFRNFVAQARGGLSAEAHETFFRHMLGDITTPTAPFDLMDVHGDGSQMAEAKHELPTDLAVRMRQQVRCMGATPAALCHLAWALVLSRCCNQEDVVFGTVLFGRMQGGAGIERALGMFINTLPLRITCDTRTVAESLHETQQKLLALMRHEHASLSLAQRCNAVPAPMPLFSALLNYRHSAQSDSAPQLEGVELLQAEERSNFPFSLSIDDLGEGFALTAQVDLSISPDRICLYMQQALQALVTTLENTPQTPLNRLNILPLDEQQQLLIDWNATATPSPESCVHQLFEAQVRATPEATAVVFENETLSYDQLNTRANQLAHHLIDLGVNTEVLVAIALERSPAMIVALLAVFKAGGAYVPLDPDYPVDRLTYMLEDCDAGMLITQESLREQLPQSTAHALYIDGDGTTLAAQPQSNPDRPVSPDNLAYVIYTSGSTGKPKGVMIEQRGLVNFMLSMQKSPGFSQQDSLLAVTTISFDIFGLEIYLPLISGGKIVLARSSDVADPASINNLLLHNSITIMQATPATWRMLVDTGWSGKADLKMLVGGEALPGALAKKMLPLGNSLWNLYGPTETTIWSSRFPVANENTDQTVIPIGRPIANTQLYILDRHDQLTPIGVPGELHIGGTGLARGYLNRPELTAEKFIPDPFSDEPGARLYKTGDLVRYRADGNIEFLGRLDHQVKIRGFRIELGEIEAALAEHPDIRETVVVARTEESGEKRLVAYLVADASPEPTELRAFLKLSLPDYMLPAAFVFLEELPLTPNGKVDRKALPEPEARLDNAGYHLPRDSFEQQLIEIWESVLSVRPIGINDNFFDIGGHSLLVVRLITEMNKKFRKHLPISRLFEFPTIAGLASLLRQDGDMPAASCLVKIRQQGSRSPLFVLPGASGMTSYLYPFAHHLDEDIPFFAFQARGLEGEQLPHTDFEEMVTHYVDLLLEAQPTGPYFLAGHSFGSLVAFAMAQRLLAQGQDIGMLYILDTPAPTSPHSSENNWLTGEVPLLVLIGQFLYVIFDREINFSKESVEGLNDQEQLTFIARQLAEVNLLPEDDIADHLRGLLNVFKTQLIMQNEYLPESYLPLPITLFRARERMMYLSETETYDEDMGWGQYSSRPVPVHYVPGNHVTMMTLPEVKSLAALMTSEMRGLKK